MSKLIDLTGQTFGRLTVIKRVENAKNNKAQWLCQCSCGKQKIIKSSNLIRGATRSCGCIKEEKRLGELHNSRLHRIWNNMKQRCSNPKNTNYVHYGKRGITVCKEWIDFKPFYNWALSNGYKDTLSIDRIDVNGNYEPNNCRWVNNKTQSLNRTNNRIININGEAKTLTEWCDIYNIDKKLVYDRLERNWDEVKAIITPKRKGNYKNQFTCERYRNV